MTSSIPLSPSTVELLAALGAFSSGRLTRPDDLGLLFESAARGGVPEEFDELSFQAKFVHRTFGIMQRLGKDGQGYDRLQGEFQAALERCGALAREGPRGGAERGSRTVRAAGTWLSPPMPCTISLHFATT